MPLVLAREGAAAERLLTQLRETAETEAIRVFARNLNDLLLAAPAEARP